MYSISAAIKRICVQMGPVTRFTVTGEDFFGTIVLSKPLRKYTNVYSGYMPLLAASVNAFYALS